MTLDSGNELIRKSGLKLSTLKLTLWEQDLITR